MRTTLPLLVVAVLAPLCSALPRANENAIAPKADDPATNDVPEAPAPPVPVPAAAGAAAEAIPDTNADTLAENDAVAAVPAGTSAQNSNSDSNSDSKSNIVADAPPPYPEPAPAPIPKQKDDKDDCPNCADGDENFDGGYDDGNNDDDYVSPPVKGNYGKGSDGSHLKDNYHGGYSPEDDLERDTGHGKEQAPVPVPVPAPMPAPVPGKPGRKGGDEKDYGDPAQAPPSQMEIDKGHGMGEDAGGKGDGPVVDPNKQEIDTGHGTDEDAGGKGNGPVVDPSKQEVDTGHGMHDPPTNVDGQHDEKNEPWTDPNNQDKRTGYGKGDIPHHIEDYVANGRKDPDGNRIPCRRRTKVKDADDGDDQDYDENDLVCDGEEFIHEEQIMDDKDKDYSACAADGLMEDGTPCLQEYDGEHDVDENGMPEDFEPDACVFNPEDEDEDAYDYEGEEPDYHEPGYEPPTASDYEQQHGPSCVGIDDADELMACQAEHPPSKSPPHLPPPVPKKAKVPKPGGKKPVRACGITPPYPYGPGHDQGHGNDQGHVTMTEEERLRLQIDIFSHGHHGLDGSPAMPHPDADRPHSPPNPEDKGHGYDEHDDDRGLGGTDAIPGPIDGPQSYEEDKGHGYNDEYNAGQPPHEYDMPSDHPLPDPIPYNDVPGDSYPPPPPSSHGGSEPPPSDYHPSAPPPTDYNNQPAPPQPYMDDSGSPPPFTPQGPPFSDDGAGDGSPPPFTPQGPPILEHGGGGGGGGSPPPYTPKSPPSSGGGGSNNYSPPPTNYNPAPAPAPPSPQPPTSYNPTPPPTSPPPFGGGGSSGKRMCRARYKVPKGSGDGNADGRHGSNGSAPPQKDTSGFIGGGLSSGGCGQASEQTFELLKEEEGWVAEVTPDPVGHESIGYGHKCVQPRCAELPYPIPLSRADGEKLMREDWEVRLEMTILLTSYTLHDFYILHPA